MTLNVLMRGSWLSSSGYGTHCRSIARWLLGKEKDWNLNITFQVLPWGITPWLINPNYEDGLIGKIIERTDSVPKEFDVSIQVQLPHEWDNSAAKYNVGVTAAIETDKCNPEWVAACNRMDAVVFPSEHARKSITNVGNITTKNLVIPEAYNDAYGKEEVEKIDLDLDTNFNFLIVGQMSGTSPETDRKNILHTLRWMFEVFKDDQDVGIVLKTNLGRHTNIDRHNCATIVTQVIKEIRIGAFPKVHLVHGMMTDEEMASLYRNEKIKALVSLTRGEGFGLPLLEAAVSGLPVISTGWSGHTEFLSKGKSIEIDYSLSEVHKSKIDGKIFVEGSRWAKPSESDFKKKVKKFRDSPTVPKEWASNLRKKLLSDHSQAAIEKKYDEFLEKVFKR